MATQSSLFPRSIGLRPDGYLCHPIFLCCTQTRSLWSIKLLSKLKLNSVSESQGKAIYFYSNNRQLALSTERSTSSPQEWPTGFVRLQSEEDLEVSKISNIEVLTELAGASTLSGDRRVTGGGVLSSSERPPALRLCSPTTTGNSLQLSKTLISTHHCNSSMPQFTRTVSQPSRAQLLSAATAFQLDNTGTGVTALRARVKAHIDSHEDLMGDPDYRPLFSPTQRRRYPAYPAPWGGIDATPSTPRDQSDEDDDLDEADETPPGTVNQPSSDLQALKSLPSTTLAEVLDLFIQNKVSTPFIQASFFQV
ncbi:hypothetical protein B0H13DRAFT_1908950 [Mycena leptocephala]|nr:hypothetical protein B0H13DRAFT_1908950 [Mycena leptocephala]